MKETWVPMAGGWSMYCYRSQKKAALKSMIGSDEISELGAKGLFFGGQLLGLGRCMSSNKWKVR